MVAANYLGPRVQSRIRTTLAITRKGRLKTIGREAAAPRALCRVHCVVLRLPIVPHASTTDAWCLASRHLRHALHPAPSRNHCEEDTSKRTKGFNGLMPKAPSGPAASQSAGKFANKTRVAGTGSKTMLPNCFPNNENVGQSQQWPSSKRKDCQSASEMCGNGFWSMRGDRRRTMPQQRRFRKKPATPTGNLRLTISAPVIVGSPEIRRTPCITCKGRLKMTGREAAAPRAPCQVHALVMRLPHLATTPRIRSFAHVAGFGL
jgi:hypothetical protein